LDPTFLRAELQESPLGQAYPRDEGGYLAVIYQRTGEERPAVISWGPEQILRHKSGTSGGSVQLADDTRKRMPY